MPSPNQLPQSSQTQDVSPEQLQTQAHYASMVTRPAGDVALRGTGCFDPEATGEQQLPFGD